MATPTPVEASMIDRIEVLAVGPDVALMGWAHELAPQHAR
jgi:hypothetical protein